MTTIHDRLRELIAVGSVPGGCADCHATQTMEEARPGVFVMTIHHDDTCPWLAARRTP